jgi:hypothetical protein
MDIPVFFRVSTGTINHHPKPMYWLVTALVAILIVACPAGRILIMTEPLDPWDAHVFGIEALTREIFLPSRIEVSVLT